MIKQLTNLCLSLILVLEIPSGFDCFFLPILLFLVFYLIFFYSSHYSFPSTES